MSVYCSFCCLDGDEPDWPAPIIYRKSHVLPTPESSRGGSLNLGHIPGFITCDGRDRTGATNTESDDEGVWPYLRVTVSPVQPQVEQRRLQRKKRLYSLVLRAVIKLRRRFGDRVPLPRWQWPEDTVVLDRDQVEQLRDALSEWLFRCDDPDGWLEQCSRPAGGGS